MSYEDETVLANGPVRRLLSRPDALHCDSATFAETWPQLARSGLYPTFGYYCLLPLAAEGRIFGGCEFIRDDNRPWTEKEYQRLHTFTQIVAVVTEQIQSRVSNNVDYDLLCHERDNFRILVAITNAVLSRLDIDELVSEVTKEIHRYFRIDAISVVLRSNRKGKLNIYSTHYLDASHPVHDQSEVDEAGTLTERVFKSKEMLLLNLHEHDPLAPYEKMLFEMWDNKIQTLCLLPLMSGNTLLGVLKLAQCDEKVFTTTNLKLLRQIAERVSIAIDNALAYREIQRLKERLVDENLALTEQLNNERLGSNKLIHTDVRLIAATNRDLKQMVADREFRSDLYYRLNVFPIHLPPLRERPDDIPLLVKAFTFKIARRLGRNIDSIPAETLRLLSRMEWPGNVRELENVIERAVLLTRGSVLQLSLPEMSIEPQPLAAEVLPEEGEDEYQLIVRVLKESNGVVAGPKGAAQRLGLKRTTLLSRMKRLGIHKDQLQ